MNSNTPEFEVRRLLLGRFIWREFKKIRQILDQIARINNKPNIFLGQADRERGRSESRIPYKSKKNVGRSLIRSQVAMLLCSIMPL